MGCFGRKSDKGKVPVYLNVYDLTPMNGYGYWLGLGAYHSGVQVHGREYAFGPHERSTSGVFNLEPKSYAGFKLKNPSFRFRKSVLIGKTDVGPEEIRAFMDKLAEEYPGNTYQLINKNCNHFSNEACLRLTGKTIPGWVNRLARLGSVCNCVLPAGMNAPRAQQQVAVEGTVKKNPGSH